jgi:hypothetical protein
MRIKALYLTVIGIARMQNSAPELIFFKRMLESDRLNVTIQRASSWMLKNSSKHFTKSSRESIKQHFTKSSRRIHPIAHPSLSKQTQTGMSHKRAHGVRGGVK